MKGGREVKILAISASGYTAERREHVRAGFDDFTFKPFRPIETFGMMARHLGLRYRSYEIAASSPPSPAGELRPEALAALAPGLRRELLEAVAALDRKRIHACIDSIARTDDRLAAALRQLADQFTHTAILNAAETAEALAGKPQSAPPGR